MLFLVAAWIGLLAASVPTGAAILRWTDGAQVFDRLGDRLVLSAWLGVLVLGNALLAASLLFALSPLVGAAIGLGLAAAALAWSGVREEIELLRDRLDLRLIAAFLALAAGVGIFTAQPVVYIDTGLYHAGAIRWLSEYGAVEGTALIQSQLGFASSWFALAAPFNPEGLRDHAMALMGGFALLMLALHCLICLARAPRRTARPSDWLVVAGTPLLIALPNVQALVSASPDIPINVLVLLVASAILTVAAAPRPAAAAAPKRLSPGPAAVPLLLALGAMTVKPQAAPLVAAAALFYLFAGDPTLRRAVWVAALGILLLAPWVAYEFVTTGCPAYPLPLCTDVAWSVDADTARQAGERIREAGAAAEGSGSGWVAAWLTDDLSPTLGVLAVGSTIALGGGLALGGWTRLTSAVRRAATWVVIAGALGSLLFLIRAEEILMLTLAGLSLVPLAGRHRGTGWLLALGLTGIALTLYAGAQSRFAVGYMAVLFARLAVFQWPRIRALLRPRLAPIGRLPQVGLAALLVAAASVAALVPLVRPTAYGATEVEGLGWRLPPMRPTLVRLKPVNGIHYRVPDRPAGDKLRPPSRQSGLCWAAELPCTGGFRVDPTISKRDVVLRDPDQGIAGGFELSARGG